MREIERCPLTGASKAVSMLSNVPMIIVGTEECTYYTKSMLRMKGMDENCYSVVLNKNDVTFGAFEKVENACCELLEEKSCKELYIITTCVVEIIGDDYSKITENILKKYKTKVHILRTNHYTGKNGEYGMELVFGSGKKINKMSMIMKMAKRKLGGGRREFN